MTYQDIRQVHYLPTGRRKIHGNESLLASEKKTWLESSYVQECQTANHTGSCQEAHDGGARQRRIGRERTVRHDAAGRIFAFMTAHQHTPCHDRDSRITL